MKSHKETVRSKSEEKKGKEDTDTKEDNMKIIALIMAFFLSCGVSFAEIHISDFGGFPNGSDTSPALKAASIAACNGKQRVISLDAGRYEFLTPPDPLNCGISLKGQGVWQSYLVRQYSEGEFLIFHGELGGGLRDLTVYAGQGTSGGVAVHVQASDFLGPVGNQVFQNVVIDGDGTWALPLFLDGWQRTQSPAGVRTVFLQNVKVFNATWWAVEWWGAIGCEWFGGGAWQGGGTTQAIAVGGPMSTGNRIDAMIDWSTSTIWEGSLRR